MNKTIMYGFTFLWLLVLVIMFVASSTDLIFNENEVKVYNVSLVLDDSNEHNFEYFRAGMEKALKTENIELNTYLLQEPAGLEQQMMALEEALGNGADAVIVKPVNDGSFQEEFEKLFVKIPVICLDGNIESDKIIMSIHGEDPERGIALARQIQKDLTGSKTPIYALGKKGSRQSELYESLENYLTDAGYQVSSEFFLEDQQIAKTVTQLAEVQEDAVIVALDTVTLERVTARLEDSGQDLSVYGFGRTSSILKRLEQDEIKAININHEFYMGWLSLHYAVQFINKEYGEKQITVENYTVGASDMFTKEYEDVLFPVN